jgi:hypothetical protein
VPAGHIRTIEDQLVTHRSAYAGGQMVVVPGHIRTAVPLIAAAVVISAGMLTGPAATAAPLKGGAVAGVENVDESAGRAEAAPSAVAATAATPSSGEGRSTPAGSWNDDVEHLRQKLDQRPEPGRDGRAALPDLLDGDVVADDAQDATDVPVVLTSPARERLSGQAAWLEQIADATPLPWREIGGTFVIGCHPQMSRCHWGAFDHGSYTIWIGDQAFASERRLTYVVLHELVHLWQWSTGDVAGRMNDLSNFGFSGLAGLEAAADCLALVWGATMHHYYDCPAQAQAQMAAVYENSRGTAASR